MTFRSLKIMVMKVLKFHQICLELLNLSYPLKCPKSSEPSKHFSNNIDNCFRWTLISNNPKKIRSGRT